MRVAYLTRHDEITAGREFDSIEWCFQAHVKHPDTRYFNFAVLHGNEDAPSKIEFWVENSPTIGTPPAYVWEAIPDED